MFTLTHVWLDSVYFLPSSDQLAEAQSFIVVKVEDGEVDEGQAAGGITLSCSPTFSDVSISR